MRGVVLVAAAQWELEAAAKWYEARRPELAADFISEVDHALARAAANPQQFPRVYREFRCVRLRRFPYSLYFLDREDRIVVLAVFHASRAPNIWRQRQ
jgi:plasmid stabilization system protein ParE